MTPPYFNNDYNTKDSRGCVCTSIVKMRIKPLKPLETFLSSLLYQKHL